MSLEVAARAADSSGAATAPEFDECSDLFVGGVKLVAVAVITVVVSLGEDPKGAAAEPVEPVN